MHAILIILVGCLIKPQEVCRQFAKAVTFLLLVQLYNHKIVVDVWCCFSNYVLSSIASHSGSDAGCQRIMRQCRGQAEEAGGILLLFVLLVLMRILGLLRNGTGFVQT